MKVLSASLLAIGLMLVITDNIWAGAFITFLGAYLALHNTYQDLL